MAYSLPILLDFQLFLLHARVIPHLIIFSTPIIYFLQHLLAALPQHSLNYSETLRNFPCWCQWQLQPLKSPFQPELQPTPWLLPHLSRNLLQYLHTVWLLYFNWNASRIQYYFDGSVRVIRWERLWRSSFFTYHWASNRLFQCLCQISMIFSIIQPRSLYFVQIQLFI